MGLIQFFFRPGQLLIWCIGLYPLFQERQFPKVMLQWLQRAYFFELVRILCWKLTLLNPSCWLFLGETVGLYQVIQAPQPIAIDWILGTLKTKTDKRVLVNSDMRSYLSSTAPGFDQLRLQNWLSSLVQWMNSNYSGMLNNVGFAVLWYLQWFWHFN